MPAVDIPAGWADISCNLCGEKKERTRYVSRHWSPQAASARDYQATTDSYGDYGRIVQCRKCGLVYTSPRLASLELLAQYVQIENDEYMHEDASRSINGHFSLHTVLQFVSAGKWLDVGCSTGYLLNAARLHFETLGVEPNRQAAEFARQQLKLEVHQGTLAETSLPAASFDVVSMVDVIEHLSDPMAELRAIARVLKPGGYLYLVTPNVASFTARVMRSRWWGLRPAHIYYFAPKTLRRMLEAAGFDVVLLRSYGRTFSMGYWLSRLRHYSKFINWSLQRAVRLLGIDRKLVYINTRDSMECVARKRS